ncbi:hypothetical protein SDC9_170456 [bioreactor metagenome]|uniref:Uncharacterized protein n=1 Tax=bioreactor metagenome TaxID=1076179 RepID=A0A645G838_9ZZZZ
MQIHARQGAFLAALEAEAVLATHFAERRDMELLACRLLAAPGQVGACQQIGMALAKGVVDFRQHGGQRAIAAVRIPETYGLENVAQHAREGVQPDCTIGSVNAFAVQQLLEPVQGIGSALAVVAVVKADPAEPFAPQHVIGLHAQAAHWQHEEVARISEGMFDGAQTSMPDMAEADEGPSVHAAPLMAGLTGSLGKTSSRPSAASSPDRRPSS